MIKVLIELQDFLLTCAPLLVSTLFFALFGIVLSKSIKKHPTAYYIAFAIPFVLVAVPTLLRWCGVETFSFTRVPVLGQILRDYIHMGTFGHPLLIIIMYMGALDPKIPGVKKLMSIRKELSIISGFPILTHSLIRVANNFPNSLKFFTHHEEFMASGRVESVMGAGISNFSFVLGILMLALFIPLWITSFDSVHKRMGAVKWKKLQKWSYVLYATLFIHAMGIQIGGMMNPRGGSQPQRPATEVVAQVASQSEARPAPGERQGEGRPERGGVETAHGGHGTQAAPAASGRGGTEQAPAQANARRQATGFSNITVGREARQYINIATLLLIYGSYLYLRVRKARKAKIRRLRNKAAV